MSLLMRDRLPAREWFRRLWLGFTMTRVEPEILGAFFSLLAGFFFAAIVARWALVVVLGLGYAAWRLATWPG